MNMLITLLFLSSCTSEFTDEMQTFDMECLREDKFPCNSGGCVMQSQYCDGIIDCEDGTDENFCPEHLPDAEFCNETHQFLCEDKRKCIPHQWICNTEWDCDDGSDEVNCTAPMIHLNSSCKGFKCGDGKCISDLWVCDGVYDCVDKSDEDTQEFCRHSLLPHEYLDTSSCPRLSFHQTNYKCKDSSYCLPSQRMCDGLVDCRDGSDEGDFCKHWHSMCDNHSCTATNSSCSPDRDGPTCLCHSPGNLQYNPVTHHCDDVDECTLERPHCSHTCINYEGHFMCECDEGYVKDDFAYLCYAKAPEAMLFFSTNNEIKFLNIKSKQLVTVATGIKQAHGVLYDGKYLFWVETAEGHQSIVRAHLEDVEGTQETLVGLGLEQPGDIAIDWLGGNLFFTDSDRGDIFVCRLDGSTCATLKTAARHPRYITVNPKNGKMYWSDFMDRAVIMSSRMDGTEHEPLVESLQGFPTGLTLDAPNDRLYFVDKTIKVVLLTNKAVYSLFEEPFHHPYSIAVFENTVFWSDWTSNTIQTTDKMHDTKENRHVLVNLNTPIYGMHMYHPAMMISKSNPCQHHNCSHICLPTSKITHVCVCPDGMEFRNGICKHIQNYRPQYLIVAGGETFTRIEYNTLGSAETHATNFDIGRIQAMAYDSFRDSLYMYDGQRRVISYINMTDFTLGLPHPIITQGLDNVVDMDYDYASDSLYFLDAGRRVLEVMSLRTQQRAFVYQFREMEIPISFCVMPDYGSLLVAVVEQDQHNSIHIDCIGLDGEGRHHVVVNNLKGPHIRLRYAQYMDNVFLSDEANGIIDIIHPGGTGRENYRELSTTVTSLAITDAFVFWTDRRTQRLFWSDVHESTHRIRRIDLSIFPNSTQLLIQATTSHPDSSNRLLYHPCLTSHPCSDVCVQSSIPNPHRSHSIMGYKCLCPAGFILKNGRCTKVVMCRENELYCHRSNVCIDRSKHCDGVKDCAFGEDETGCKILRNSTKTCSDMEFECGDGVCIGRALVCDRSEDCPDGSDEGTDECDSLGCFNTEFMCASGSCILKTWKCDGDSDCNDATDEIDCENSTCKAGYYQCRNRECIEVRRRCDGVQDCFDNSDEEDCEETVFFDVVEERPLCGEYEFACEHNTSICLPRTALCNKKVECPGGTDENGCEYRCAPHGRFACKQQLRCLAYNQLCNGKKECDDGSDETPDACALVNKTSHLYPLAVPETECSEGFRCSSGQCLEWMEVCDNKQHCVDGDDEGGLCALACLNHTCPHSCQATPHGPQCQCGVGWRWSSEGCEDVDECEEEPCAHMCRNVAGTFVCSCHHGYALRSDRRSCKAIRGSMSILYVSDNTIQSVSADGYGNMEFSDSSIERITDLDVNVRKDLLYVASADSHKLIEVNSTDNVISVSNIGRPTKVAVDWVTGNVYLVDSTSGDSCIRVCNVKRKRCAKLQKLPSDAKVTSLIVDPASGLMFYCITRGLDSVVWSASLSGHNAKDLATVANCTGLAADSFSRRVYVAESDPPRIVRMDYSGGAHKKIVADHPQLQAPHTLAIYEDHIYYLVADSVRLGRCLLTGPKHCETYIYRVFDANTFVIKHESVQRDDVINSCEKHLCANVCVLTEEGHACVCDDGQLARDGVCKLMKKEELPLFNGWTQQDYLHAHHASFTVITVVMVMLAIYLAIFVYYHFVYKPRKIRNSPYTEVRYQNNPASGASLSYAPTVEMATDGSISHEFVNPLEFMSSIWQQSTKRVKPIGDKRSGFNSDMPQSPPQQDLSDTESDLDDREYLIRRKM